MTTIFGQKHTVAGTTKHRTVCDVVRTVFGGRDWFTTNNIKTVEGSSGGEDVG